MTVLRSYRLITAVDSPACFKARAYLRWRNVPFRETPASEATIRAEVRPRLNRVATPVLITPDNETLHDTRAIIDRIETREPGEPLRPAAPADAFGCHLLEAWGDERLSPAAVLLTWLADPDTAVERLSRMAFGDEAEPRKARSVRLMRDHVLRQLARRGFTQSAADTVRQSLAEGLSLLDAHLERSPFLLGDRPCAADFSVYGAISVLDDPALKIPARVERWRHRVAAPEGAEAPGRFRPAPRQASTYTSLIKRAADDVLPEALEADAALYDWAETHPGQANLPQSIGAIRRTVGDEPHRIELRPESAWLLARITAPLREGLTRADAGQCEALLHAIGHLALGEFEPSRALENRHERLRLTMEDAHGSEVSAAAQNSVWDLMSTAEANAAKTRTLAELAAN